MQISQRVKLVNRFVKSDSDVILQNVKISDVHIQNDKLLFLGLEWIKLYGCNSPPSVCFLTGCVGNEPAARITMINLCVIGQERMERCVCVCVCMCERNREREYMRNRGAETR